MTEHWILDGRSPRKQNAAATGCSYTMADMDMLTGEVTLSLYGRYCYDANAKSYTYEEICDHVEAEMEQRAIAYRHGKEKGTQKSLTLNLLQGDTGLTYADYANDENETISSSVMGAALLLKGRIANLPDYPAQEFPKSGAVEGKNKGTKIVVRNRNKDLALSLTFTSEKTGEVVLVAFIRPNDKANIYIPKGYYAVETQAGVVWYGPEHRFGDVSMANVEEHFKVLNTDYYHTLTYGE